MTNINLKPCPFCGSEAKILKYYPYDGYQNERPVYLIRCVLCNASIKRDQEEFAVKAWNHRVKLTKFSK